MPDRQENIAGGSGDAFERVERHDQLFIRRASGGKVVRARTCVVDR
jgi:hypothetical protein